MNNAFASTATINYNYSLGKYNYGKYEFRGFGISTEMKLGSVVKHYFYQDDPRRGKEYETEVYDADNNIFSRNVKDFNFTQSVKGIYNVSLMFSSSYSYDGSNNPKITNTSFIYDYNGNPLLISEQGDVSVSGDERYTNYTYAYNTNSWIMDRVASSTVYDENMQKAKETKYYYDELGLQGVGSQGALTKKEEWNNNGENSFTYYDYNDFGNVISQTDSLGNINKFVYEDSGTYPERAINALGHITQYNYDLTGNLNWKESNNIKTEYVYDVFGRISKEILPYDTNSLPTKSYAYSLDGMAPESIAVSQKTSTDKTNVVRFFYDGNANLVQLKTDIENNTQIVKNIYYDDLGKVVSEDNPYFDNTTTSISTPVSSPKTNYSYDALDRVVLVKNPDSTNKTVVFDKWNITDYDENGNKHMYEIDGFGRIIKVHEYNSDPVAEVYGDEYTTTYEYDANDNLVKITDNAGNVFSFTYDSLGRKTAMDDPDLGKWTYSYDQNGNLISQTGGGGNLITGDNFYREYNGDNQLIIIRNGSTSSSPILEEYTYDPYGQRVKITRYDSANTIIYTPFKEFMRITNSSGTFDYTYVYNGNILVARVNPDGTKWFFHNDNLGSTTSITDQTGNVIENISYSPFGEELTNGNSDIHGYTGQEDDELTNQMYYGARYYKPETAQFTQPDSVIQNIFNPQDLNHYAYVRNNPYKAVDPDGRRVEPVVENVGGEDIIAIYENGGYVGRVVDEVSTTISLKTQFGTDMDVTTYDYVVQPGSKSNVRGTLHASAYDSSSSTEMLSDIYDRDKKNLLRDENIEIALSVASDIYAGVKVAGKSSDILRGISTVGTGVTIASAFNDPRSLFGLIPFMSTITTLVTQDKGYQRGSKIPEFSNVRKRGGVTYGSYGDASFSVDSNEIIVVRKVK